MQAMATSKGQRQELGEAIGRLRSLRDMTYDQIADGMKGLGVTSSASKVGGWAKADFAPRDFEQAAALDTVLRAEGEILGILGYGPSRLDAIESRLERLERLAGVGAEASDDVVVPLRTAAKQRGGKPHMGDE